MRVQIQSEDEGDYLQVQVKVNIVSAPSNEFTSTVTARVSNYDYLMQLILAEPQGAPDSMSVTLPPGGQATIPLLFSDIGTSPYVEQAIFTIEGMDSTISTSLTSDAEELAPGVFTLPDDSVLYYANLTLSVMGEDQNLNGEAGVVRVCAASMRNAAVPSCIDIVVSIATVHDIDVDSEGGAVQNTTHPGFTDFLVTVTNSGNIAEQIEITSTEGLRGWTIDIEQTDLLLEPDESETIRVRVKPPVQMMVEDEFEFTLIVTPESAPVAAQPVDLTVKATLDDSVFGFSSETWNTVTWSILGVLGVMILFTIWRNRRRSIGL